MPQTHSSSTSAAVPQVPMFPHHISNSSASASSTLTLTSLECHCLVRRVSPLGFAGGSLVKNPPASLRDTASIPRSGRTPGRGNGSSLQYSCLENPMDRGAWRPAVPGIAESATRASPLLAREPDLRTPSFLTAVSEESPSSGGRTLQALDKHIVNV